ncbi:MAG: hypothetical protein R3E77_05390 [Steroidobacteraceae bacterium]
MLLAQGAPSTAVSPQVVGPTKQPAAASGLSARPPPVVESWMPGKFAIQGDRIRVFGTFVPRELSAWFAVSKVPLRVVGQSGWPDSGTPGHENVYWVDLQVPADYVTSGESVVGRHGTTGRSAVMIDALKVLKRPRVKSWRIIGDPVVHILSDYRGEPATRIEIDMLDFDPDLAREQFIGRLLDFAACAGDEPEPGYDVVVTPSRLTFDVTFRRPYAGRTCPIVLFPYGGRSSFPTRRASMNAGSVRLPALASYTIDNTSDLLRYTTASGKRLQAGASKGLVPCQLASIGSAGTFPTGVVLEGGDLTFQLRNGLLAEQCTFTTTPALEVRDGWLVADVVWQFTRSPVCGAQEYGQQQPSHQLVTSLSDERFLIPVTFDAWCRVNEADPARNGYLYEARLARVELVGPPGQTWQNAFK